MTTDEKFNLTVKNINLTIEIERLKTKVCEKEIIISQMENKITMLRSALDDVCLMRRACAE